MCCPELGSIPAPSNLQPKATSAWEYDGRHGLLAGIVSRADATLLQKVVSDVAVSIAGATAVMRAAVLLPTVPDTSASVSVLRQSCSEPPLPEAQQKVPNQSELSQARLVS